VAWVKPGDDFFIESVDWTAACIKNNDSRRRRARHPICRSCLPVRPIGVKGAEPGDPAGVDLLDVGPREVAHAQQNARLPDRSFPAGAEIDLDIKGLYYVVAPQYPVVSFAA